jgi:GxxExxY protein
MAEILYKTDVDKILDVCLEVYNRLGYGFQEVVYKDAMEVEFREREIKYIREHKLIVEYKGLPLKRTFDADFTIFERIIVEVKVNRDGITGFAISQTLNYLKASEMKLGLVVNFGRTSLDHKRLIF